MLLVWENEDLTAWLGVPVGCALYIACSRAEVRWSALYAGSASETSGQAGLVYGRAPKVAFLGSWDMYSLALQREGHGAAMYDSFDLEAFA